MVSFNTGPIITEVDFTLWQCFKWYFGSLGPLGSSSPPLLQPGKNVLLLTSAKRQYRGAHLIAV